MGSLHVPTVTLEDLQAFQTKHFPDDRHTKYHDRLNPFDNDAGDTTIDEDGLGYYPDGVKRTLTDEQIEIFRHSEVHALLRQKQLREEELAEEEREEAEKERLQREGEADGVSTKEHTAQEKSPGICVDESADQIGSLDTPSTKTTRLTEEVESSRAHKRVRVAVSASEDLDYDDENSGETIEASGGQKSGSIMPEWTPCETEDHLVR